MTYSDKSRHNQDSSTQVVPLSELRERVAEALWTCVEENLDPELVQFAELCAWDEWLPEADAAIAAVLACLSDPDTQLPRQAIYAGKMATFDALGADDIERVIRAVAGSLLLHLEAPHEPAISEDHTRHSGEAQ